MGGLWTPDPKVGGSNPLRHAIHFPLISSFSLYVPIVRIRRDYSQFVTHL